MSDRKAYKERTYVAMALDPIHVGKGGIGLGRVDLEIVRDPVTRIPKIPGSSLAGVHRAYSAMYAEEIKDKLHDSEELEHIKYYPNCAGQKGHCGKPECPICTVYGHAKDSGGGFGGLAAFTDAHVLLFPVPTLAGPKWVTSPMALRFIGWEVDELLEKLSDDKAVPLGAAGLDKINFGWLYVEVEKIDVFIKKIENNFSDLINQAEALKNTLSKDDVFLVSDKLFTAIVNSNLEVRTSVSINPMTGAAEDGALFSYEALPRFTVIAWKVIAKDPKHFGNAKKFRWIDDKQQRNTGNKEDKEVDDVFRVVEAAHDYLPFLGIGGMSTRGMGRIKVVWSSKGDGDQESEGFQSSEDSGN